MKSMFKVVLLGLFFVPCMRADVPAEVFHDAVSDLSVAAPIKTGLVKRVMASAKEGIVAAAQATKNGAVGARNGVSRGVAAVKNGAAAVKASVAAGCTKSVSALKAHPYITATVIAAVALATIATLYVMSDTDDEEDMEVVAA